MLNGETFENTMLYMALLSNMEMLKAKEELLVDSDKCLQMYLDHNGESSTESMTADYDVEVLTKLLIEDYTWTVICCIKKVFDKLGQKGQVILIH